MCWWMLAANEGVSAWYVFQSYVIGLLTFFTLALALHVLWGGQCKGCAGVPWESQADIQQHFCIGCAWMFMWDVYAFTAENTSAVNVARRMAGTVGVVLQRNAFDSLDTFIPMWCVRLSCLESP